MSKTALLGFVRPSANHGPWGDFGDTLLKHHNPATISSILVLNYDFKSQENLFLQQIAAHRDDIKCSYLCKQQALSNS